MPSPSSPSLPPDPATLAARGFAGHVVLELNTRGIGSRSAREDALARALEWSREALTVPVVR